MLDDESGNVEPVFPFSWVSVLQNSKQEALNTALGGDQLHLQDSGLQELSQSVITELRHMPGNEACADCGAPGQTTMSSPISFIYYFSVFISEKHFVLFLLCVFCRSDVAVHQSGHPHLYRMLWYPQRPGSALLQDSVPHTRPAEHL